MTESASFLAQRLRDEGDRTVAYFKGLTESQWSSTVYSENARWALRDLLAHFVSVEKSFQELFHDVQSGGGGAPDGFSIDRFNAEEVDRLAAHPPEALLGMFAQARSEMSVWVAGLSPLDLQKTGRHPGLGMSSLAEMIKMVYLHNQIHLRDARKRTGIGSSCR